MRVVVKLHPPDHCTLITFVWILYILGITKMETTEEPSVIVNRLVKIETPSFSPWDYVVFAMVLVISAGIGVFFGVVGKKKKTTKDFLMAGKSMGIFPVSLSLLASFMSAITLLGTPSEIYTNGTQYWIIWLSYGLVIPLSAHFFLPVFYRLNLTSVFEVKIFTMYNSIIDLNIVVIVVGFQYILSF